MKWLKNYLLEVMSCLSRLLNVVLFNGNADWTTSGRVYRDKLKVRKLINAMFFWEDDHCKEAYLEEIRRSRINVERHEKEYS